MLPHLVNALRPARLFLDLLPRLLRPVEVLPEPERPDGLTLIAPSGVRIEGLAMEQAAHLLRLLA